MNMLIFPQLLSCFAAGGIEQWLTDKDQIQPSTTMITDEYDEPTLLQDELEQELQEAELRWVLKAAASKLKRVIKNGTNSKKSSGGADK